LAADPALSQVTACFHFTASHAYFLYSQGGLPGLGCRFPDFRVRSFPPSLWF
jgi:hypothetical protein